MSQTSKWQNWRAVWTMRFIGAIAIFSPMVFIQCSAQRNEITLVRPLEDAKIGIGTIDPDSDVSTGIRFRARWVSFTGARSAGPALDRMQALGVRTSVRGDRFVVWYSVLRGERGLLIIDLMGKELWRMLDKRQLAFALSPDGGRIAFQSRGDVSYVNINVTKNQMNQIVELKSVDRTRDQLSGNSLGWSPDSGRIVYEVDGRIQIWNLDRGSATFLIDGHDPTWSPNGDWIAYRALDERPSLIDPSTRQIKQLRSGRTIVGSLRWSPDSRYLLFSDNHGSLSKQLLSLAAMAQLTGRLGVYDTATDSELIVFEGVAAGTLDAYGWVQRRQ